MSELFRPLSAEQLAGWLFGDLDSRGSAFGIPRQLFFEPHAAAPFRTSVFGQPLDTPLGPAAGPHTQMAQNIVTAWLCGARYIELKTVQTLDELNVSKPCIDMQDEGYNVEWSQELKVYESFDEYLRAWVLIHALHHKLGFAGDSPNVVFNLSVGYDLEGVRRPNMRWFLDQVADCSEYKQRIVDQVAKHYPAVRDIEIPNRLSDNVTLSTMHGCPPGDIESISAYLLRERGLHTLVKCNPTLLGPERVRNLINGALKYTDVVVPDIAFEHDLEYSEAVPMLRNLLRVAEECGLEFGVKLSNTLEVQNTRSVFDPAEKMSYLSGRPLHAVTVNLAHRLAGEFDGGLPMSFSAGASCFNAPDLLACGMQTVTVCSDLLKTGGYLRLLDYVDNLAAAYQRIGATDIDDFVRKSSSHECGAVKAAALENLQVYAERTLADPDNAKDSVDTSCTKTSRALGMFDCIEAPCVDECPLQQKVPQYLRAVSAGDYAAAQQIIRTDNPIPCVLGRACDHRCELTCVRTHLDEPVAIRDIKRFAMDVGNFRTPETRAAPTGPKVAIIGAGPGGMAVALELARGGKHVEIFEQHDYPGGMVGGAVPEYRVPRTVFDRDFAQLEALGVVVHYGKRVGTETSLSDLRRAGFDHIVLMVGAQLGKKLSLPGEDCDGVLDALEFLRNSREHHELGIGKHVGVIGAGDTAMDCARVAWRQGKGDVTLIYRRSIDQMPAEKEELEQLVDEGINILEMASPEALVVKDGKLNALTCSRTRYDGERDRSGRKTPHRIPGSGFDVPLDTLILAISQRADLDFLDGAPIALNERGYIDVDPVTFETSIAGIYAGGDVANDGPSSIVKAAAAGKAIADSILKRRGEPEPGIAAAADMAGLLRRRSHRTRRTRAPQLDVEKRQNFDEVVGTFSEQEARKEAARCLDCDTYCGICVGVCPNLALFSYRSGTQVDGFEVSQPFQVAVLADLCNECGNCTTFCPTSGRPYRDKPRIYVDRSEFEQQNDNAFLINRDDDNWVMNARHNGITHRVHLDGQPEPATEASPVPQELEKAMHVLLHGLRLSQPYLPAALPPHDTATARITHPGYDD